LGVGASINAIISTMNTVNTAFLSPSSSFVSARGDAQPGQLGGGVWARTVVGTVESKATTTSTIGAGITGTGTCGGVLREDYYGYQLGSDLINMNIGGGGGNFHFGITGGYINSSTQDQTKEGKYDRADLNPIATYHLTSPAGSLTADAEVPFVGVYAAYTLGNLFIDGQVRQDFYLLSVTDPLNGLSNQSQNGRGISAGANMGYKIPLPSNWFIEPSAGIMWSRVQIDPIPAPGTGNFLKNPDGSNVNKGDLRIDDIESILGRASLRIGATIPTGTLVWQPFVSGSVVHEFAGDVTAASVPTFGGTVFNTSTSRVGTFTQIGIGTATAFGNSGWLAYGRADYRTGDSVEGYSFNTGVRYQW
jgi:Autotransporter beta-domain